MMLITALLLFLFCHVAYALPKTSPAPAVNPEYVQAIKQAQSQPNKTSVHINNMMLVQGGASIGINRAQWKPKADSHEAGHTGASTIDSSTSTYFESEYSPKVVQLPHDIVMDMEQTYFVSGLQILPRQDGSSNGNIGQHSIQLSVDGNTWTTKAIGTFFDDSELKMVNFTATAARYFRIIAYTEAGNRGPYTSAADLNVYTVPNFSPPPASQGSWGLTIDFPLVPAAAAIIHGTGQILTWSAYEPNFFDGYNGDGITYTATYDPATQLVSELIVSNTDHDMFCPGLSLDTQGRPVVSGGSDAAQVSLFNPASNAWSALPVMNIPRGYNAQTTLSNGNIFTIGGSFSGGTGGKNGELYDPVANTWTVLSGCPVQPMLTNDAAGVYRSDNHGWLFAWSGASVFQAGPSKAMNWYGTSGTGTQSAAGLRGSDNDAMCGNAVMYDAANGKILTMGGGPNYDSGSATTNANLITIGTPGSTPSVQPLSPMAYARSFANGVVLPNGQVLVVGGQTMPVPFTDTDAIMIPELWDPVTQKFTPMAPIASPRTYHSVALLLPDATVFSGGGGLCGSCSTNHFDGQIWTPPYLLNSNGSPATRPTITSVSSSSFAPGTTLTVNTGSAVTSFSLVRYGSATHALNTDQRRIALTPKSAGTNSYTVTVPSDPGIALPGSWMLFALNAAGTPSLAQTVLVT